MLNDASQGFMFVNHIDPHQQRRKEMLEKYPEIKALIGYEWKTKYIGLCLVILQLIVAFYVQNLSVFWWFITLYFVGATLSHIMFTAIHEVTHNLAFESKIANRLFAMMVNLPLGIPAAMAFEKYHSLHHRFIGVIQKDVDIPLRSEAALFHSRIGKLVWLLLQPLTYTLRPWIKWPQKMTSWEWANLGLQVLFDVLVYVAFGFKYLAFLVLSTIVGMGLHPLAAHFIAEHYVVNDKQESYSYYGPFNYVTFNVGHHVEHHDFPGIPWSRISQLRRIAPEYYEKLYQHRSWILFTGKFLASKKITLFSRVVRNNVE